MIIVIDYDAGNTANVLRALSKIGVAAELSADADKIRRADGLILPGVGAFPTAMAELEKRDLVRVIKETVASGTAFLGICLGMQLLLDASEEHVLTKGLGLIPGVCREIPAGAELKVPHMGWNSLDVVKETALTADLKDKYVYFVHSYFTDVALDFLDVTADYGMKVPAMISRGNVYGAQFHPEKSGDIGLGILEKFKEVVYANSTSD
ncbi:imidazole glycerol phosphate synthase subunit HisH [Lactococcus hodotermopsidis]|uniref:Imidazole glycerol phosphate synthase subunit HisH n=1 Tax=Pseudolactococcus hodotermopsidis TaxID=2709157 RepID=A0A6A0BEQ1_9LACT|nr:imidazole glycerol phosphate synthase subunit HisH [Lactococcus hodotermopsidis]GFH42808.1 imidazole glycerol phosphate synthase subunit HisH [Lactococcus hodotermopsidis]